MPGGVADQVYAALLVADQYGQRFLQEWEVKTPGAPRTRLNGYFTSKRSRSITFAHAATKSRTNFVSITAGVHLCQREEQR